MKVILIQDVKSLGKEGDVVEVSDGHARNFLFPQNMAIQATAAALQKAKRKEETQAKQTNKEMSAAGEKSQKLDGYEIILKEKASEAGVFYAAVGAKQIASALSKAGFKVKEKNIALEHPFKEPGEYTVMISFEHGFEAEIRVMVEAG